MEAVCRACPRRSATHRRSVPPGHCQLSGRHCQPRLVHRAVGAADGAGADVPSAHLAAPCGAQIRHVRQCTRRPSAPQRPGSLDAARRHGIARLRQPDPHRMPAQCGCHRTAPATGGRCLGQIVFCGGVLFVRQRQPAGTQAPHLALDQHRQRSRARIDAAGLGRGLSDLVCHAAQCHQHCSAHQLSHHRGSRWSDRPDLCGIDFEGAVHPQQAAPAPAGSL